MDQKVLFRRIFICVRIVTYISVTYAIIKLLSDSTRIVCHWNDRFGILCPSCGATRATLSIIKGNLSDAFHYNLIYSVAIFPLALILIIDDILFLLLRLFNISTKRTLIEVFFDIEGEREK